MENDARAKKNDREEVEITVWSKDNGEDEKAEEEEEGQAEKRGWLCISKTMQCQILHEAQDIPAGAHFGAD